MFAPENQPPPSIPLSALPKMQQRISLKCKTTTFSNWEPAAGETFSNTLKFGAFACRKYQTLGITKHEENAVLTVPVYTINVENFKM
jgi:hypothetical protein